MEGSRKEAGNYDYVNARLRARNCDFLAWKTFPELACDSLAGVEKALLDSPYGVRYRSEFMGPGGGGAIRLERAVSAETEARYRDLKSWTKGEARVLLSVLSVQSDLENGMLFLRALSSGRTSYLTSLPGCGELTGDFWRRLTAARSDRALIAELCRLDPSPQSDMLECAHSLLEETGNIDDAEWFYMKNIFAWAREALKGCSAGARPVRESLDYTIDLWNLRTWLGLHLSAGEGGSVAQRGGTRGGEVRFLEGGTLHLEDLLFAKSWKALLRGSFWEMRPSGGTEMSGGGTPLLDLDRKFLLWQLSLRRQDPLGVQVMISYLARLYCEWRNLMTILEGLQSGLSVSALQSVLLLGRG